MASHVPFTDNVQDLSTDKGFQFKFCCERCGNGYMSSFQANMVGMAGGALQAAGSLFGGVFGRAANSAYDVQRMVGGPAHDAAMRQAVTEVSPEFNQCPRCGQWVCRTICWNGVRHQCVSCSPKMDQEIAALESEGTIHQLRQQANSGQVDLTGGVRLGSAVGGQQSSATPSITCSCGTQVASGARFCPDCGQRVNAKPTCPNCGVEGAIGARFCGDCGHRFVAS
ncbi:zinc ribbon domain-containing protein [bacterium]|nr:MAG: zinc ribbon domain-containing protein [bacterium]